MSDIDTRLWCHPQSVLYDFETRTGVLVLPPDECCDMAGCIRLFESLDKKVEHISVIAGLCLDTKYDRDGKKWRTVYVSRERNTSDKNS